MCDPCLRQTQASTGYQVHLTIQAPAAYLKVQMTMPQSIRFAKDSSPQNDNAVQYVMAEMRVPRRAIFTPSVSSCRLSGAACSSPASYLFSSSLDHLQRKARASLSVKWITQTPPLHTFYYNVRQIFAAHIQQGFLCSDSGKHTG